MWGHCTYPDREESLQSTVPYCVVNACRVKIACQRAGGQARLAMTLCIPKEIQVSGLIDVGHQTNLNAKI